MKYPPLKQFFMKTCLLLGNENLLNNLFSYHLEAENLVAVGLLPTRCQLLPNGQSLLILSDSIDRLISITLDHNFEKMLFT